MAADQYWVTWKDESSSTAARASALIWGPQATAPAQLSGYFMAGPFPTKAAAEAYEKAIGTGSIIPTPGTPVVGDVQLPSLPKFSLDISGIAGWFFRGLKVLFGGVLLILAVSHLTGVSNKITEVAGKVAPIAAVA